MDIIKVKYHDKELTRIQKLSVGDWLDLRAAEDVEMKQGEYRLISLGISVQLPPGFEAHVVPRSSTFKNFGVIQSNHMGVIDESYSGDNDVWMFGAIAMRDTKISKNDRICQFRILAKQPDIAIMEVESLGNKDRGGFGSTGIK